MDKIEIYNAMENGKLAVGIKVKDKKASLADLLDSWQMLCEDPNLFKMYAEGNYAPCRGCLHNCCNTAYVIPDLISFKKMARYLNCSSKEFISQYFHPDKTASGLLRLKPNPCVFLKDNICTIYPVRSLICRFYVCAYLLGDTEQLIYSIAMTGIAATCLFAEEEGLICKDSAAGMSSFDMMFKKLIAGYRDSSNVELFMRAGEYDEIPLLPFL